MTASGAVERREVGIGDGRWAGAAGHEAHGPRTKDARPPSVLQGPPLLLAAAPSSRLDRPTALEMSRTHTVDVVVQVHGHADVVRHHPHHVTDARSPGTATEIEHAVLLRHPLDDDIRVSTLMKTLDIADAPKVRIRAVIVPK